MHQFTNSAVFLTLFKKPLTSLPLLTLLKKMQDLMNWGIPRFLKSSIAATVVGRPQRDQEFSIPGFLGWEILQNPGIFRDGISLKFYPGILPKKYGISRDFLLSSKIWSISYILEDLFVYKIHYLMTDKGLIHPILWQAARASGCSVLLATWWPEKEPASHQRK